MSTYYGKHVKLVKLAAGLTEVNVLVASYFTI